MEGQGAQGVLEGLVELVEVGEDSLHAQCQVVLLLLVIGHVGRLRSPAHRHVPNLQHIIHAQHLNLLMVEIDHLPQSLHRHILRDLMLEDEIGETVVYGYGGEAFDACEKFAELGLLGREVEQEELGVGGVF